MKKQKESGTTFIITLTLGLLAIGAAGLVFTRANSNQMKIIFAQGARQAVGITETLVAKSLSTFHPDNNQYVLLSSYDGSSWIQPNMLDLNIELVFLLPLLITLSLAVRRDIAPL